MGSLFRYTFHLWLRHKARQELHHILKKKCLKACTLLQCIQYIKLPFLKNLVQALQSNLP